MAIDCLQQPSLPFGIYVKCPIFFYFNLEFIDIFNEAHNIRVHRNSSSGRHAETCRQTERRTKERDEANRGF